MTAVLAPVFPTPSGTEVDSVRAGINLRDWFAGQAIPSAFRKASRYYDSDCYPDEQAAGYAAHLAYQIADAMIVARGVA